MKKIVKTKPFIAGMMILFSALVLTVCIIWERSGRTEFAPDAPVVLPPIESWTENTVLNFGGDEVDNDDSGNSSADEQFETTSHLIEETEKTEILELAAQFPLVISENNGEVIIQFTDLTLVVPVQQDDTTQPPELTPPPIQSTQPPPQPPQSNTPIPGSVNERGEVYNAAFGWVMPSPTIAIYVDNDGDINKMVGNMN
jgi:hypothetical protein